MAIPSIKKLTNAFGAEKAQTIRKLMERFHDKNPLGCRPTRTMDAISDVLNGSGVEYIEAGAGAKSPAIYYVNMGDTYDTTVMWVRGRFRVGSWGDIVENGNYA